MPSLIKAIGYPMLTLLLIDIMVGCQPEVSVETTSNARLSHTLQIRYQPHGPALYSAAHPTLLYQGVDFYYVGGFQTSYHYDSLGRPIVVQRADIDSPTGIERGNLTTHYSYRGNTIISQSSLPGRDTLLVNKWGHNTSAYLAKNTLYTYDQQGYLLKKQMPSLTISRSISKGNVSQEVIQEPTATTTTSYEYDLTQPNLTDPLAFLQEGKLNRNRLTQAISRYESGSFMSLSKTTYGYEYDEQGRVRSQQAYWVGSTSAVSPTLTVTSYFYVQ